MILDVFLYLRAGEWSKTTTVLLKEDRSQLKETPTGQRWDSFRILENNGF